ncbi:16863_t:CDS:2, partial [Racocetra fulgida]
KETEELARKICFIRETHYEFDGEGGSSLLVDGFHVARQLKMKSPIAYKTLSTIAIPTHSAGDQNTLIQPTPSAYPILNHDPLLNDSLYQIRYNNDDRSTMNNLEPDQVLEFYDALRKWNSLLKDESNEYWFQLKPGRVVIFDNWRVLHGRDKFSGHRRLIGCYLNWDDYQSRLKTSLLSQEEIIESL